MKFELNRMLKRKIREFLAMPIESKTKKALISQGFRILKQSVYFGINLLDDCS